MTTQAIRRTVRLLIIGLGLAASTALGAPVPNTMSYHGRVTSNGASFDGEGQFKFALVNAAGTVTHWSNDGTSANGGEPASAVTVPVEDGLFVAALGDTNLVNMTAIPATVFSNPDVHLRLWFNDGQNGFAQLVPDQPVRSVGYAMMSASVPAGAITAGQLASGSVSTVKLVNEAVTTAKLADGAVTTAKLADQAVTIAKLAPNVISAPQIVDNSVTSFDIADQLALETLELENESGLTRMELSGTGDSGVLRLNHGVLGQVLEILGTTGGGRLGLFDKLGGELTGQTTAMLGSESTGGYLRLFQDTGNAGVQINGQNGDQPGGTLLLYGGAGLGVDVRGHTGNGGGELNVHDSAGHGRVQIRGPNGTVQLFSEGGQTTTLRATGDAGELVAARSLGVAATVGANLLQASLAMDERGGVIRTRSSGANPGITTEFGASSQGGGFGVIHKGNGENGVAFVADTSQTGSIQVFGQYPSPTIHLIGAQQANRGGRLEMTQGNGQLTVVLDAEGGNEGGFLTLSSGDGTQTIVLDANSDGEGRITTQVLEITGGSDLSEQFEIESTELSADPGTLVCIDPTRPGRLVPSTKPYDRTVAGVISGAGGVKPGMLMGQEGTLADGRHPVALSGRVYCRMDARHGAIAPGDLITTSATPGHGMKVSDHERAQGAVIGKAMSRLDSGQGLVLVLVSLQ